MSIEGKGCLGVIVVLAILAALFGGAVGLMVGVASMVAGWFV